MTLKGWFSYIRVLFFIHDERRSFFPSAPRLEERVIGALRNDRAYESEGTAAGAEAGGFGLRAWVIAGCFIILAFGGASFGVDFGALARTHGDSFLAPVGITFGVVLTAYCAVFIGSHLKKLRTYFDRIIDLD
jgi:hypothetical protein